MDKGSYNYLGEIAFECQITQDVEMTVGNTPNERIRWARIQKGWLIKTIAAKTGINPGHLSTIERRTIGMTDIKVLRKLAVELEQPIWYLGCFENMPEGTFLERLEKARFYHGHTKEEMAAEIGVHVRTIFKWKDKEPGKIIKEKALLYCKILD